MSGKRATKRQIDERILKVYEFLLSGKTNPFILRYSAENWNLETRQTETYIAEAYKLYRKALDHKIDDLTAKHYTMLMDLYEKNYEIGDYRECRAILETLAKLLGLNQPEKLEITESLSEAKRIANELKDE